MKSRNRTRLSVFLSALIAVLLVLSSVVLADEFKVARVTDGDTIKIRGTSGGMTIRLVGIDAPEPSHKKREPGQPFSQQATKYLAGLVLNKTISLKEYGKDRYGRTLAEVYLEGRNINIEMVKAGSAEVYRGDPRAGLRSCPVF